MTQPPRALDVRALRVAYLGAGIGVHDVSLQVRPGQIVALLGMNGAGKTTTLRAVTGFLPSEPARVLAGQIEVFGVEASRMSPHRRVSAGISVVPERSKVFRQLTVAENLQVASRHHGHLAHRAAVQEVFDLFPALSKRVDSRAGYLSGGERQMLGIGRALMTRPKLLLADEVSLGIAPNLVVTMLDALRRVNQQKGISVLLVEQNAAAALRVADYVYVLENGRVAAQGTPAHMLRSNKLHSVYLGIGHPDETRGAAR